MSFKNEFIRDCHTYDAHTASATVASQLLDHLAAEPAINAMGKSNPKVYVPVTFYVGFRHIQVDALVDGGNTFASCISKKTFDKLPYSDLQLQPSATESVSQAGAGARLKVLGKLPDNVVDDGFHIADSNVRFPLTDIYVVDGMTADFNISQLFMHHEGISPDYPEDQLVIRASDSRKEERIPMHPRRLSTEAHVCNIYPDLAEPTSLHPGEQIDVVARDADPSLLHTFAPRVDIAKGPDPSAVVVETPWQVRAHKDAKPPTFRIRNCSTKKRWISKQFALGSICNIDIGGQEYGIQVDLITQRRQSIRALLKIQKQFEKRFLSKVEDLFLHFYDVFSWDNKPGKTDLVEHEIHTGQAQPVWTSQGPMSPDVRDIIRVQVNKWLNDNVICQAKNFGSSWNSRILLVPKKKLPGSNEREMRTVLDFRPLNRVTIPENHPFTAYTAQETLKMMSNASVFSCLDVTQGFHCIPIKEKDQYKTAFTFDGVQYWFLRCPFGLQGAPSSWGKLISKALAKVSRTFLAYYMDDIIIFSETPE